MRDKVAKLLQLRDLYNLLACPVAQIKSKWRIGLLQHELLEHGHLLHWQLSGKQQNHLQSASADEFIKPAKLKPTQNRTDMANLLLLNIFTR